MEDHKLPFNLVLKNSNTVKAPRETTLGTGCLVLVERLVPSQRFPSNSLYVTIIHHTITEHKNNHCYNELHNDFDLICLALSTSLWTHRKDML